jgi:UPF0755 protein
MRAEGLRRLAVLAVAIAVAAFAWALFQPFGGNGGDAVRVTIPKDAGVSEIGDILDRRKVVPSSALFAVRARLAGDGGDLKPGVYTLREHMTYGDVLDRLVAGPASNVVQLTIPEGLSRREITPLAGRAGVSGDYLAASARGSLIPYRQYGLTRPPITLEGFLFPATYELRRGRPVGALVDEQLAAVKRAFAGVDLDYARRRKLSAYEVLTIASMVEREAAVAKDRPLIAAVIYNRLRDGLPLQIDATIRYATGNWTRPLRRSELRVRSPYNTRFRTGLPPGPIGNPGLASIEAAARPARSGNLYYVVKPCGNGAHAFAETEAQFQRLVARYNAARDRRGGKSPAKC